MDALQDLRVLDLSTGVAGPIVGMFLADFGADVVKVEPPSGDPARSSPGFAMWNRGKRGVVVDPASPPELSWLRDQIAGADVVLTNGAPTLDLFSLQADELHAHPALVHVSMPVYLPDYTPWAGGRESAGLLAAFGGQAARQSSESGDPVESVYPTVLYAHGVWATVCTVAALVERERSGVGQEVTVSGVNALQQLTMTFLVIDPDEDDPATAVGAAGRHPTYTRMRAGDGLWLGVGALGPKFEAALLRALELEYILDDTRIGGKLINLVAPQNIEWVQKAVSDAFLTKTRAEWLEIIDRLGVPCGPVDDRDDWLDHPQLAAIGMRAEVDDPERGHVVMPGVPINLSRTPGRVRGPAPRLGEHTGRVEAWPARKRKPAPPRTPIRPGPLSGYRILNTGTFLASPYAGSLLASLGAEVIKVEPPTGDPFRAPAYSANRGMRSLAIDLKSDVGRDTFYRIVAKSDAFMDALRPGLTTEMGIDYDSLQKVNPGIVTMSLAAYGHAGAMRDKGGVDMVVQCMTGMMKAEGGDDEPVANTIAVCDIVTAAMSSLAVCLALYHRERTGEGQATSDSLIGTATYLQSGEIIRFAGRPKSPVGGRNHKGTDPINRIYQAADGWIRLDGTAVPGVRSVLAAALGIPEAALDTDSAATEAISTAVAERNAADVVRLLNSAGVPAVRVRTVGEVIRDPRLANAEFLHVYPGDDGKFITGPGNMAHFSRTHRYGLLLPPGVGEHTADILAAAGFGDDELAALSEQGAVVAGAPMVHALLPAYR
ncbi:CaiB/BaiF CoA transferase family protein [Mycolicibacterium sp.]|uniref:CaiB/BaiF CoA transferase family protein n=1 Tax=Mycolicibacterium sp. TaxID=2320850 RepID=UPI003D135C42